MRPFGTSAGRLFLMMLLVIVVAMVLIHALYHRHAQPVNVAAVYIPATPDIRVLTANIEILLPNQGIHAWSQRRHTLEVVLRGIAPDIIGMQESTPAQTAWLASRMNLYNHFPDGAVIHQNMATTLAGPISTWNQIWYRSKRFRLLSGAFGMVRPHHPQNNPTENTYYSLVVLHDRAELFPNLMVLDVHLRHTRDNAIKSVEKLHAILLQWQKKYPAAQVVLLGDMNHSRSNVAVYQALLGSSSEVPLVDTFDYDLHKPDQPWGTWENYTDHTYSPWPTDLIFVSPQLSHTPAKILRFKMAPSQYPSDHFFVLTVLNTGKDKK